MGQEGSSVNIEGTIAKSLVQKGTNSTLTLSFDYFSINLRTDNNSTAPLPPHFLSQHRHHQIRNYRVLRISAGRVVGPGKELEQGEIGYGKELCGVLSDRSSWRLRIGEGGLRKVSG